MKTLNRVLLIGYLGADPVVKTTASGLRFSRLRVATDHLASDTTDGATGTGAEPKRQTAWHDIIAWDKKAELAVKSFSKGSHILVEGQIEYRSYRDGNGNTRQITEIRASKFLNLDR